MTVRIELAWPPRQLSPNARCHHMEQYRFKKAAKDTAYWLTKAELGHMPFEREGEIPVRIVAHPIAGKLAPDFDNCLASLKAPLDGIALALGVDDKLFRPTIEFAEPVSGGRIVIEVER
jgi:crossover junction endodeoxyribonuclease RusA